ncbi:unnamed protein product, partial [Closterium sp. NIES-53]
FYHPTSRRVLPSQDVTFDDLVPFYLSSPITLPLPRPHRSSLLPVDVGTGAARGAASGGAVSGGAEPGGAEFEGARSGGAEPGGEEPGGAEPAGVEPGGDESEGAESGGAKLRGVASSGGPAGASLRLSPQQLREWFVRRARLWSGGTGAGGTGDARAVGAGVTARAGGTRGTAATGPGGAHTRAGGTGAGGIGAGGAGAAGAGAVDLGAGGTGDTPASPLPTPSPYTEQSGGLTERREPASRPVSPVRTARRVPHSRPPPVPSTYAMALLPSSVPLRVPLPPPPESSLPEVPDPDLPLLDFAAACRIEYATALVAESASASPPSVEVECALSTDVLEDRQEDYECLAAAVPQAITGSYSSQWQAAMDAEMASWKSTGTYVDEVPPHGANIVDGMWIFRRQGVDYFQTFSPTSKMTSLRVLLHVAAQRDYKLHSLDFSTAVLQGSVHEIWQRRPPGFTESTTLAALGFAATTADPLLFLRTDTSLPPFYVLVYITKDRARCTITLTQSHMVHQVLQRFGFQFSSPQPTPLSTSHLLSAPPSDESIEPSGPYPELVGCLMYLMTCTRPDLAYPLSLLPRYVAPVRQEWGLCLEDEVQLSSPVTQTLPWVDDSATQRSSQGYTFSLGSGSISWRSTRSSSVLSFSCEAEIYARAMAAQELRWLTTKHIALQYFLARELQQCGQLRLAYVATRANTADIFTKALPPGDHQRFSTVLGLVPTLPHLLTA